eukprot:1383639-Prymnesium_polylepis.1
MLISSAGLSRVFIARHLSQPRGDPSPPHVTPAHGHVHRFLWGFTAPTRLSGRRLVAAKLQPPRRTKLSPA